MASPISARGFTLVETIVATGILVTALAGLAQLFVLGTHLGRQANASGAALIAAQDKLESLRGLTFEYDDSGAPVTDDALLPSSASSLTGNVEPYVEWLNADGQVHEAENEDGVAFVRRWRITALGATVPEAVAIEVCVFAAPVRDRGTNAAEACLSTVRTRQP